MNEGSIAHICVFAASVDGKALHRFVFPHPTSLRDERGAPLKSERNSIFSEVLIEELSRSINHLDNICKGYTPTVLCAVSDRKVVVGCSNGSVFMVNMGAVRGQ